MSILIPTFFLRLNFFSYFKKMFLHLVLIAVASVPFCVMYSHSYGIQWHGKMNFLITSFVAYVKVEFECEMDSIFGLWHCCLEFTLICGFEICLGMLLDFFFSRNLSEVFICILLFKTLLKFDFFYFFSRSRGFESYSEFIYFYFFSQKSWVRIQFRI